MKPSPKILIVEDDALDAQMTCWGLAAAGYAGTPLVVTDGAEALALFRGEAPFVSQELPDLVVLDLNLRLMDGSEVLDFIRESPLLHALPVVVLSSAPEHVMKNKAPKADAYLRKSSSVDAYADLGKKLLEVYFQHQKQVDP